MAVKKWVFFILLCLIWGSSFMLMKLGMFDNEGRPVLTAWQVAGLRIFSASIVLLPFSISAWRRIPVKSRGAVVLSGLLGSFFPAFLFCIAESRIESALAATLNSLTPLFALLVGVVLYRVKVPGRQLLGIIIGLAGCLLLFVGKLSANASDWFFASLVMVAALFYALNGNMVRQRLGGVSATDIAALAFAALLLPSGIVLWATGYFQLPVLTQPYLLASTAALLLGVVGTASAAIFFYRLVKIAGPVFASMVTYGIPFIAIGWGFYLGEDIGLAQVLALLVILTGVFMASQKSTQS